MAELTEQEVAVYERNGVSFLSHSQFERLITDWRRLRDQSKIPAIACTLVPDAELAALRRTAEELARALIESDTALQKREGPGPSSWNDVSLARKRNQAALASAAEMGVKI